MRFKAKLAPEHVSTLYSLIVPISRLSSSGGGGGEGASSAALMRNGSMLYLDDKFLRLSVKGKSNDTDGIACFAELTAGGGIFLDHRIESAAKENQIVMELDIVQLRMALQSIQQDKHHHRHYGADTSNASTAAPWEQQLHQHYTVLKLAKRNNIPCLCIEAYTKGASVGGGGIQVHHAIPVRICRPNEMQNHLPPAVTLPDVQLEMQPDQYPLRTVMERLRSISPTVYLNANMSGELTISMDSDGSSIRTIFSKLTPRQEDCKEGSTECNVKVDSKKLTACLQWQQQQQHNHHHHQTGRLVSSALLCLVENEALVLHVMLNPPDVGFFTYYIPVHFISRDDE